MCGIEKKLKPSCRGAFGIVQKLKTADTHSKTMDTTQRTCRSETCIPLDIPRTWSQPGRPSGTSQGHREQGTRWESTRCCHDSRCSSSCLLRSTSHSTLSSSCQSTRKAQVSHNNHLRNTPDSSCALWGRSTVPGSSSCRVRSKRAAQFQAECSTTDFADKRSFEMDPPSTRCRHCSTAPS
jgi:hypothetical protein